MTPARIARPEWLHPLTEALADPARLQPLVAIRPGTVTWMAFIVALLALVSGDPSGHPRRACAIRGEDTRPAPELWMAEVRGGQLRSGPRVLSVSRARLEKKTKVDPRLLAGAH